MTERTERAGCTRKFRAIFITENISKESVTDAEECIITRSKRFTTVIGQTIDVREMVM